MVFLSTTNYFDRLSDRMIRPSRFDVKIEIEYPSKDVRTKYLSSLFEQEELEKYNIDLNVVSDDTEKFNFAELKELYSSIVFFDNSYDKALKSIKEVKSRKVGFGGENY